MDNKKVCKNCGIPKDTDEFYKYNVYKDGLRPTCKKCCLEETNEDRRIRREKEKLLPHPEKVYYPDGKKECSLCGTLKDLDCFYRRRSRNSGRVSACKVCHHAQTVVPKKFGISIEIYFQMIKEQNNQCKICGKLGYPKSLSVDHCHKTGKVRGLICGNCNSAIGFFGENVETVLKAYQYLKECEK